MPPGRKYDKASKKSDQTQETQDPTPASLPRLTLSELADKATYLFRPNLFPPRRERVPLNPLFAQRSSRLPPPAAEIDERPRIRVRRFKLFGQGVPELRICVLDPKRRCKSSPRLYTSVPTLTR